MLNEEEGRGTSQFRGQGLACPSNALRSDTLEVRIMLSAKSDRDSMKDLHTTGC
jgi:hypothetical protein